MIVGLPDAAVKESRDRVMTALINSGFNFTFGRTTINLAPADVKRGLQLRPARRGRHGRRSAPNQHLSNRRVAPRIVDN